MIIKLPKLEEWQMDVYTAVNNGGKDIFVVKSKRQVGKSVLAVCLMIKYCLSSKCISVCVEPTQAQSRRVYKQVCDFLEGSGAIVGANATLLTIQFANGSELLFKSAEQRDALRGFTVSGILVIDEAAFIPNDIFEILYATTDAYSSPILVISTPLFCSGEFYELYMRGINGDARVMSFNWSLYDTSKYLSADKLEYYRNTVSPLKFRSEYLGEFITEGSYLFGDIIKNIKTYKEISRPRYGGIDWATGNDGDYTVLTLMDDGGVVTDIYAFKDTLPTEQIKRLSEIINQTTSLQAITVEMNSIGSVFYDNLRKEINVPIICFNTTNESKRRVIEQLINAFQSNLIWIPNDDELIRELQHYAVEKTKTGYTYNGADGVNDDYVISLALAYETYLKKMGVFNFSLV